MEGNFEKKIRDKNSSKDYSRTTFEKTDPRYAFGTKLKARMKEKGYTVETLKNEINKIIIKPVGDQAIRDWMQHYSIPETTDRMYAICKIFAPYSFEYFMDIVKEEPTHNLQYIYDNTGISSLKAIENLKAISRKHKGTLNAVLESEYIEDIVQCIESSKGEKHHVLRDEYNALDYIENYIDFYGDTSDDDKGQIKMQLDSLQQKIDRLSDEAINKPFDKNNGGSVSAFEIAAYKLRLQESFNDFFKSIVPELKSFHYPDLKDIFDKLLKPTESLKGYSEDYFINVLFPLHEIIKQEKIPQYHEDTEAGKVIENKDTKKKISTLYEKAQKIIEKSGNDKPIKPTKKKSQRKKV